MPLRFHPYSYKKGLMPDVKVMRYMNLEHFKELVLKSQLYLHRCDLFTDIAEGSLPSKERQFNHKHSYGPTLSKGHQQVRKSFFASCWHLNDKDSALMWSSFLGKEDGIAIITDIDGLRESFHAKKGDMYLTRIRYINYDSDAFYSEDYPITSENMFTPLTHKSPFYEQEREVRLLASRQSLNQKKNDEGIYNSVDTEYLIKGVIFKPKMDVNTRNELFTFCTQYLPYTTIMESSIQQKIQF